MISKRNHVLLSATAVLVASVVLWMPRTAQATRLILEMDTNGSNDLINPVYPTYGDNVTGALPLYYTDDGEGYTPNVTMNWNGVGAGWITWSGPNFTPLSGIAYLPAVFGTASIDFVAAPGYKVRLLGFQVGNWEGFTTTYENIQILGATGNPLTSPMTYTVPTGASMGTMATIWPTPTFFEDTKLTLTMTNTTGVHYDWVAFDNIRFSQVQDAAVPEPSTLALAVIAASGLALFIKRYRNA